MSFFPAGLATYTLQSSVSSTQTTITLSSFKVPVSGDDVTMTLMNTSVAYGTIAPRTSQSEFISFTGITQNPDGTATLTGVTRGLNKTHPFTTDTDFKLPHAGASQFILSDAPGLFNEYSVIQNDETITGKKTFPGGGNANAPVSGTVYAAPTADLEYAAKKYVDDVAIAGSPDATLTVKGIVEIATTAEIDAGTATGATGASVVARPDQLAASIYGTRLPTANQKAALVGDNTDIAVGAGNLYVTQTGLQKQAECYAATATGNDTYVITLSPAPTSLVNGMTLRFKADVANTGAATLNVNGLGALSIVTGISTALATGDIVANQVCEVIYNSTGTVWQLVNPASTVITSVGNDVPNTLIPATWHSWTVPAAMILESGPTYSPFAFVKTGTYNNPTSAYGGGGTIYLSSGGAASLFANVPGNGSNTFFTAASSKDLKFKTRMKWQAGLGSGVFASFGIAEAATTLDDVQTSVAAGIRFVLNNATLYASSSDGSANTNTDISASLTYTDWNVYEVVFNPGTDIKFYVNGTLVATHTTNLPTGSLQGFGYGQSASATIGYISPTTFSLEQ